MMCGDGTSAVIYGWDVRFRAACRTVHYGFTAISYRSRYRTVEDLRAPSDGHTQYGLQLYFTIENGRFGPSMAIK